MYLCRSEDNFEGVSFLSPRNWTHVIVKLGGSCFDYRAISPAYCWFVLSCLVFWVLLPCTWTLSLPVLAWSCPSWLNSFSCGTPIAELGTLYHGLILVGPVLLARFQTHYPCENSVSKCSHILKHWTFSSRQLGRDRAQHAAFALSPLPHTAYLSLPGIRWACLCL